MLGKRMRPLTLGGDYEFRHCTMANYSSRYLTHQAPVLVLTDYYNFGPETNLQNGLTKADFINCIIYGSIAEGNELAIDTLLSPTIFNFNFDHCIIKSAINPDLLNDVGCFFNTDPVFANVGERNYCPTTGSPALNAAIDIPSDPVIIDIVGNPRPFAATLPDIGCYETEAE
jgi:hypothetical protein